MINLLAALVLAWTVPAAREDGTALGEGEIIGYELYRDGEPYASTEADVLELEVSEDGDYTVRAIDSDHQISDHSNVVAVKIRARLKAPGLHKKRHRRHRDQ